MIGPGCCNKTLRWWPLNGSGQKQLIKVGQDKNKNKKKLKSLEKKKENATAEAAADDLNSDNNADANN